MRKQSGAIALLLLFLLVGTQLAVPKEATAAPAQSPAQTGWWNNSYQFRRQITVADGGSTALVNQTVVLHLNFTGNEVEDPFTSVRLVDSSGNEVPSIVVGPSYAGIFLRSAYLVFRATLQPNSTSSYFVYYGGTFQSVPSYRTPGVATSLGSGFVTAANVPLSLDSTQLRLSFGTLDSETIASRVSYVLGAQSFQYGPTEFSALPFVNDSGLMLVGALDSQTTVAYDGFQAGPLMLTRIIVLSANSVLTIDAISNGGAEAASNVALTSVVGLDGLSALGTSQSSYNDGNGLLVTQNPDAYFGVQQSSGAASFELGNSGDVVSEASSGHFSGTSTFPLASAAGFGWNLGALQPSGASWVSSSWGVATGASQLSAALLQIPMGATLGQQQVRGVATPTAESLWSTSVTFTNLPVPPSGLVIPFGVGGGDLVAGASSVSGTYAYSVPPTSLLNPNTWTPSSSVTANGTAYVSPSYFAFDIGQTVQRVSGEIPNAASTVTASLASKPGIAVSGSNAVLQVKYKASQSVTSGSLTNQELFISADLDPTLTGNFSQSVVLPVSGSSDTIPTSGCAITGNPAPPLETITPAGFLIGDGTWRTLSVGLPPNLPTSGFNVMLRICLSTSPGFSGELDLEVASVGVVLNGPTQNVLQSTFSSSAPQLTMDYLPQAQSVASVGTTVNMTVSLVFLMNSTVGWNDGKTFSGAIAAPSMVRVNDTSLGQYATVNPPVLDGVLVGSAASIFASAGEVNGASQAVSSAQGVALLNYSGPTGVANGAQFSLSLTGESVSVTVLDQNNAAVSGVQVMPLENERPLPVTALTGDAGVATMQLVPWSFQFNATFQGQVVGTGAIQAGAQPTVTVTSDLYNLTLLVKDSRGGVLPGAQVALSIGSYNFTGTTDAQGEYTFEGIANALYSVTIYVGSSSYFVGQVSATANNVVIQVTTSYATPSEQLLVTALLALVPVVVVVGYFLTRRFRKAT